MDRKQVTDCSISGRVMAARMTVPRFCANDNALKPSVVRRCGVLPDVLRFRRDSRLAACRLPGGNCQSVDKALIEVQTPKASANADESLEAQRQILQLKDTVAALRLRLEGAEASRAEAVQAAVAVGADEIRILRTTIATLRDELQALQAAKEAAVQAAVAAGQNEAHQLHLTIQTLRDQLERELFDHKDAQARQLKTQQAELKQLHETITVLRTDLERKHGN